MRLHSAHDDCRVHTQGTVGIKKKKGEIQQQPRNFVTATPKKGSFGFIGTTLRCVFCYTQM